MIGRKINPWWIVAAGAVGSALGSGPIMVYAYGVLSIRMAAELGWPRELLAANMTAFLVGSGLGVIMLGWLIARQGIRLPASLFVAAFGGLFAAVAILPPKPWLFQLLFLFVGIASAAATAMPYSVAISGFFDKRRGLALGMVVAGSGVGATIFPLLTQAVVGNWGWRFGFVSIGATTAIVSALGILLLVRTPEGAVRPRLPTANEVEAGRPFSTLILRNRDFWLIAVPILDVSIATFGAMGTMVPFLRDQSVSPLEAASMMSFAGLSSLLGRLLVGYLLDRLFAPYLTGLIFILAASGLALLIFSAWPPVAYVGVALVALAMGSEADLVTYLVSRYFRLVEFSRAVGLIWVTWAWGGGVGTAIAGWSYANTQSYVPAYISFIVILIISALIVIRLRRYRSGEHALEPVNTGVTLSPSASRGAADAVSGH